MMNAPEGFTAAEMETSGSLPLVPVYAKLSTMNGTAETIERGANGDWCGLITTVPAASITFDGGATWGKRPA